MISVVFIWPMLQSGWTAIPPAPVTGFPSAVTISHSNKGACLLPPLVAPVPVWEWPILAMLKVSTGPAMVETEQLGAASKLMWGISSPSHVTIDVF
jgi:hypothetical protein